MLPVQPELCPLLVITGWLEGFTWALSQTSTCLLAQSDLPPPWPPDLAFPSRAAGGVSRRPTRVLAHFRNCLRSMSN